MEILFTSADTFVSRAIRKLTGEPVSHCAIQWGMYVIHSTLRHGVHLVHYDEFIKDRTIHLSIRTNRDLPAVTRRLLPLIGKRYDLLGLLYLGLRYILPWLPKHNLLHVTNSFLCTELVSEAIGWGEDPNITPFKLYIKLNNLG